MADTKISALPAATPLTGAELFVMVQGAGNVQCSLASVLALATGGGPHFVTPAGGYLDFHNVATTEFIKLDDSGVLAWTSQVGGSLIHKNGGAVVSNMLFNGGGLSWNLGASLRWTLTIATGGNINYGGVFNALTESGFASYSRAFITATPGSWAGAGSPNDLETAVDRIAAAVAGLLGGGIP